MRVEKKVSVLGAGAWGTALSLLLARNGCDVLLWAFELEVCTDINRNHKNGGYLSGITLPNNICATNSLQEACAHSEILVEVVPVKFLRNVLEKAEKFLTEKHRFLATSKGIEEKTLLFPIGIIEDVFGKSCSKAALGGPNFAKDVASGGFTAAAIASSDSAFCEELEGIFASDVFRVRCSDDAVGVQVSGAVKNVVGLAVGIARGAGLSDSSVACIVTRGLNEMCKLTDILGGTRDMVYSYPGVGDLVLTSTSEQSRNFCAGKMLGQGVDLVELQRKFSTPPEGINTAPSLAELSKRYEVKLPVCEAVQRLICAECSVTDFVQLVTY